MKKTVLNMMKVLLVALMVISLPGMRRTVNAAEEKELAANTVYAPGDTIVISENAYIVHDASSGKDNAIEFKSGRYVLPELKFQYFYDPADKGYWETKNDFLIATNDDKWGLEFHSYSGKDITEFKDDWYKGVSVECYSGDGTIGNPFLFTIHLEKKAAVSVSFEIGKGHEEYASKIAAAMEDFTAEGSVIKGVFPATDKNNDLFKVSDVVEALRDAADKADPTHEDKGQFIFTAAPKPASEYKTYMEIQADVAEEYDKALDPSKELSIYLIWMTPLEEVSLTIANPLAGTKVTYTEEDGFDQSPVPAITITEDKYTLGKHMTEDGQERDAAFYITKEDEPKLLNDVVMESGETYRVTGELNSAVGYCFSPDTKVIVNDTELDDTQIKKFDNLLSFIYDIEAVGMGYYCAKGDGASYLEGSGSTLSFTFKAKRYDELTYENLTGIEIDGKPVDKESYIDKPGSAIIELQPAYMAKLGVGRHNLTALFKDGQASASFTITSSESVPKPSYNPPKTGIE